MSEESEAYLRENVERLVAEAAELDGKRAHIELEKQCGEQADGAAHDRSLRVHEQILRDEYGVHRFAHANQNVAVAATILLLIPEP